MYSDMSFMYKNVREIKTYNGFKFIEKKVRKNSCMYRIVNETGTGTMVSYELIEGITLKIDTFQFECAKKCLKADENLLQFEYCVDGCYETTREKCESFFFGKGDLTFWEFGKDSVLELRFPMKMYKGVSVIINAKKLEKILSKNDILAVINIKSLRRKLGYGKKSVVVHSNKRINEIMKILLNYRNCCHNRTIKAILTLKVMEMLLEVNILKESEFKKITAYSEPVYNATIECYEFLLNNPFKRISISELAKKYGISESSLKKCFLTITGSTVGAFHIGIKMNSAKAFIENYPERAISEIAFKSGYSNQSKFSLAFKKRYGMTPSEYKLLCRTANHVREKGER